MPTTEKADQIALETDTKDVLPLDTLDPEHQAGIAVSTAAEERPRLSTPRIAALAVGMMLTFFVGSASTASVILLIPSISRDLNESELATQWISSVYTIAFACGLLFSGRLADIFGRKRLYMAGLSVYTVSSILVGAIRNRISMCVFRAICGLGMSLAIPAGFGIIGTNIHHEPARTVVFAAFGLGNPVGASSGSLLGGGMASVGRNGWSYLFFLLSGLVFILMVGSYFVIPPDRHNPTADRRIDWLGGLLVTSAVFLFIFSMTESGRSAKGWNSPYVPALLALSLVFLAGFILWSLYLERRTDKPPIIKMSLFARRSGLVSFICFCSFCQSTSVSSWVYTSTIFYQQYKGETPLENALSTITTNVVGVLAACAVMLLAPRVWAPILLTGGAILTASCSLIYANWIEGLNFWRMEFPAQVMIPWGIDFTQGMGNIMMSKLISGNEQSVGGALFQTSAQLGLAMGISLASLITTQIGGQTGSVLSGCRAGFWFGSGMGVTVVLVGGFGFRRVRLAKDVAMTT